MGRVFGLWWHRGGLPSPVNVGVSTSAMLAALSPFAVTGAFLLVFILVNGIFLLPYLSTNASPHISPRDAELLPGKEATREEHIWSHADLVRLIRRLVRDADLQPVMLRLLYQVCQRYQCDPEEVLRQLDLSPAELEDMREMLQRLKER